MPPCSCRGATPVCVFCVDRLTRGGELARRAVAIGRRWGRAAWEAMPGLKWPRWVEPDEPQDRVERMRAGALRRVSRLHPDPQVQAILATTCAAEARNAYREPDPASSSCPACRLWLWDEAAWDRSVPGVRRLVTICCGVEVIERDDAAPPPDQQPRSK